MGTAFKRFKESFRAIKKSFFLKKRMPSPATMQLLKDIYPTINWNRVDFYEGLPWFTYLVAPYLTAQMVPAFYSFNKFRIYLKKFDETRAQCLADVVHESFHVLQAMSLGKGYGFGFLRMFMVYYIAVFAKNGYRNNVFEVPAYEQEFRFLAYCEKHGLHGVIPPVNPEAFRNISKETALVFKEHKFVYEQNILLFIGSFIFCLLLAVLKPFIDLLTFIFIRFVPGGGQ